MTDTASSSPREISTIEGFRGALDWWREAGVDCDFADDVQAWLEEPQADRPAPKAAPSKPVEKPTTAFDRAVSSPSGAPIGGDKADWPRELAAFRELWLHEPSLDDGRTQGRVSPRGRAEAELMVLVGQPDEGDSERLLSGPQGQVLGEILKAMRISDDAIYLASALPRRTAMPDWGDLAARGLGELTKHHVSLASPKRLLVFGRGLAGLLGCETNAAQFGETPLMIAPSLDNLARSAGRRKRFWNNWLDWTA